jgi:hypothetical protein
MRLRRYGVRHIGAERPFTGMYASSLREAWAVLVGLGSLGPGTELLVRDDEADPWQLVVSIPVDAP